MKAPRNFLRYVGLLVSITALTACSAQGPMNNLSLRKPAYHSSSIDYNATAQLAVDGIVETHLQTPHSRRLLRFEDGHDRPGDVVACRKFIVQLA